MKVVIRTLRGEIAMSDFRERPSSVILHCSDVRLGYHECRSPVKGLIGSSVVAAGLLLLGGILVPAHAAAPADARGGLQSYADLRQASGSAGQTINLQGQKITGKFAWRQDDPYGQGDDGGIVIRGIGGWWVRRFAHTAEEPIELDWFELDDGQEITGLLRALATRYSPAFYCRVPSQPLKLVVDFVDFAQTGTREFFLLENDAPVTIADKPRPDDRAAMFHVADYRRVEIGGPRHNLTFKGLHGGVRGGWNCKENYSFQGLPPDLKSGRSLLTFSQNTPDGESLEFRANIRDAYLSGLSFRGLRDKTRRGVISGDFVNAGFYIAGGVEHLHLDNPRFSDPCLCSWGWDGGDGSALNNGGQVPDGICRAQKRSGPGPLEMNGPRVRLTAAGPVVLQRKAMTVTLRSAGDLSHVKFRITGADGDGRPVGRDVNGPKPGISTIAGKSSEIKDRSTGWVYTDKAFKTVTSVEVVEGRMGDTKVEVGVEQYYERGRGATLMYLKRLTGSLTLEYGIPHAFPTVIEHIGNGPDDPFTIYEKDIGFTPDGVRVAPWGLADTWKSDPAGDHGPGKKFFRVVELEHDYGFNSPYNWILEATGTGRGAGYHNAHVDVACENLTSTGSTAVFDFAGDWTRYTTIHGVFRTTYLPDGKQMRGRIVLCEDAVVHSTTVPEILIVSRLLRPMLDVTPVREERLKRYPHDITIRDTEIIDNGQVQVAEGATDILLERVAFAGDPRRIIYIKNASEPSRLVSIELKGISTPKDATIEADAAESVQMRLDGKAITLPYTFD
jgi:hypothetical protein